jgi:hypothetical protein
MFGNQNCLTNAFQSIQNSLTAVSNRLSTLASSLISSTNLPVYLQNYTFSSGGVLTPYFTIVGGLPTNQSLRRTWNLVTAGTISTVPSQIIFTYDFSGVVSSYSVTIDGTLAGTFTINGQVYDAATYFSKINYNPLKKIINLTLNVPPEATAGVFYYSLFLADADCDQWVNLGACDNNCNCTNECKYYSGTAYLVDDTGSPVCWCLACN